MSASLAGCGKSGDEGDDTATDSTALHVALMPCLDCLPIYYAQQTGIYRRLGLDLCILSLQAQMDVDTALLRRRAEVAYTDLIRAMMIQQTDTFDLRVTHATQGALELVTARKHHLRYLSRLKEKMVAVARHSITDYWSDRLTDTARLERDEIFRPQINDIRLRTDMLCAGTMDAAFLPEPYASEARLRGNTSHLDTRELTPRLTCFAVASWTLRDSTRKAQMDLLWQGYEQAEEEINAGQRDSVAVWLRQVCLTPDTLVGRIVQDLPQLEPLTKPRQRDIETALQWLESRQKRHETYSARHLVVAEP